MPFTRLAILALAGAIAGTAVSAPLAAQGIPRRSTAGPARVVANAPRMLVANPFVYTVADSAMAVAVGDGMRKRMDKVVGRDYLVIPDSIMNSALVQFGYPKDAILTPQLARTLAQQIQGRVILTSTMTKSGSGGQTLTARLVGTNDDAGYVVSANANSGQAPADFGGQVAAQFEDPVKALQDAKECVALRTEKPDKAAEAAQKALKEVPNHGLAEFCLAQLAMDRKAPREEVVRHLQASVKGDPLSLAAWTALAEQYQAANDTANAVIAFQQMLRVAPQNQKLREQIFRYFLQSGKPEAAKAVADSGLKDDPYNRDLWDLKSNACLFLNDFKCAVDALEQAYQVDSTAADTLFFVKAAVAAEQRLADTMPPVTAQDSAAYVTWVQRGARRYPDNVTIMQNLVKAYAVSGQVDSSLAVTQRLMAKDTTAVDPAVTAIEALAKAGRMAEATPYVEFVQRHGDTDQRDRAAAALFNEARAKLTEPQDLKAATDLSRLSVQLADTAGRVAPSANLVLGIAALAQAGRLDQDVVAKKSCEMARQEQSLLEESDSAFTRAQSANPQLVAQRQDLVKKAKPRAAALVKAYCK